PPISVGVGVECYTEDWALIELDHKIDWDNFKGNAVDLFHYSNTSFKYPPNHLLQLQGILGKEELCHMQMVNANNDPCLIVIKSSCTTGVTIGSATSMMSYVHEYFEKDPPQTSIKWAILSYDKKSSMFSACSDSSAIIFDGKGRIGSILTSGSGQTDTTDIMYATPFYWLLQHIKDHFPHAHLYQAS
ncbi:hypothetical protein BS47DRAFT_1288800, partial [Hydnum rufescens UP504]